MRGNIKIYTIAAIGVLLIAGAFYFAPKQLQPPPPPSANPSSSLEQTTAPNPPSTSPPSKQAAGVSLSLTAIKNCAGKADCLDQIFREFLKTHTTPQALAQLQKFEEADPGYRVACHPVVHAVGRETFRIQKTVHDSFAACDQTCHSGCYHGAMERFLRGDAAGDDEAGHISPQELRDKAVSACDPNQATRFRFHCLHGMGHALMYFSNYNLRLSLAACDSYSDSWSRSSCYGGVFMENAFSATPAKRDLSKTDYHYPCDSLDTKYKADCYMMQTTRMTEMGLNTARLFEECRTAGDYKNTCIQSIGRDLSNDARISDPRLTAVKCEMGVSADERQACTRGVIYALMDNTWDGKYALPYCQSYRDPTDVSYCFSAAVNYLKSTYEKTPAQIAGECKTYAPQSAVCRETAL